MILTKASSQQRLVIDICFHLQMNMGNRSKFGLLMLLYFCIRRRLSFQDINQILHFNGI